MSIRARLAAVTAVLALGAGLFTAVPTAHAQSICDGPEPPSWCDGGGVEDPPVDYDPEGKLNAATRVPGGVNVSGWASDPDGTGPVRVKITVGGAWVATLDAHQSGGGFSGFVAVPTATGQVCATALNTGYGTNKSLGCSVSVGHDPIGNLDGYRIDGGSVTMWGWALDPDTAQSTQVYVQYSDGNTYGPYPADLTRTDVGAAHPGYGDAHGFRFTFTPTQVHRCYTAWVVNAVDLHAGADKSVGGYFCS
ncbi:hypothetical protein ABZ135_15740 [Streptomyces sp. NPDC006339]|uniref:hypothetical protein n=1 Tax=Streptomyces sp. NPDC006339 TaxID=3156755 RepID=UPI0033B949B2